MMDPECHTAPINMDRKLLRQPKSALRLQGRCFRCRKKGHIAKNCGRGLNSKIRLSDLPVELLDLICGNLIQIDWPPWPRAMFDLRLVCRTIQSKTADFFGKVAFGYIHLQLGYRGLRRITDISQHLVFGPKVQRIYLSHSDRGLHAKPYEEAQEIAHSDNVSSKQRREARQGIKRAHFEQADRSFIEHSATDGIMLVLAFQKLPNLKDIMVACVDTSEYRISIRRKQNHGGPTTSHVFSVLLSSVAHANVKLQSLGTDYFCGDDDEEGVLVTALSMPNQVLSCLVDLQGLELRLETDGSYYKSE